MRLSRLHPLCCCLRGPQVRQVFERFTAASPAVAADARFDFFMRAVWPRVKDSVTRGARCPRTHECMSVVYERCPVAPGDAYHGT